MYSRILIPVDNSAYSNAAIDLGVNLAKEFGSSLVGSHVYAARMHDLRFRQMEGGLPEVYREDQELERQRDIHDSLITKGLNLITDSYLDVFADKCRQAEVAHERKSLEGRNYQVLVEDIRSSGYDLVIIGALGIGAVESSIIGSVCERVVRRVKTDVLVVKNTHVMNGGKIIVAVDGSPQAYGGLKAALTLGRVLNKEVEAISVFDPNFHYAMFHSISGVLSQEAAKVFRFKEQEKLHEEIIDDGLAKIYQSHLQVSKRLAQEEKVDLKTTLLAGKAFEKILQYIREQEPCLLVMGRIGVHSSDEMDIGSNTENLLRLAPCHLLLTSRSFVPPVEVEAEETIVWTDEAKIRMERVPEFARGIAKKTLHSFALEKGHTVITSSVIDQALGALFGGSAKDTMRKMAGGGMDTKVAGTNGKVARHENKLKANSSKEQSMWTEEAEKVLERVPAGFMRDMTRWRVEEFAHAKGCPVIIPEVVREKYESWGHGSAKAISQVPWTEEARQRIEKIPAFVRGVVMKEAERHAMELGQVEVTPDILASVKKKWGETFDFHTG
ncbi:MAG: universal stress protein [Candidatus Binatia bacterium]|nr:universal stress protein [Candidatus Binatia bacterium]